MTINQYITKFTQLSRYAKGLIKNEADRTKKFIKSLKTVIKSKLISLQLKIYMQVVEKALEVEADLLEDSENKAREPLSFKRHGSKDNLIGGRIALELIEI